MDEILNAYEGLFSLLNMYERFSVPKQPDETITDWIQREALGRYLKNHVEVTALFLNAHQAIEINNCYLNTPYYILPTGMDPGGYRVSKLVDKATGTFFDIRVHPYLPKGEMLLMSEKLSDDLKFLYNYSAEVPAPVTMGVVKDYMETSYLDPVTVQHVTTMSFTSVLRLHLPEYVSWMRVPQ